MTRLDVVWLNRDHNPVVVKSSKEIMRSRNWVFTTEGWLFVAAIAMATVTAWVLAALWLLV